MTDDILTKELFEPYRITPSHCEYRQILREDNADLRLTRKGYELGVVEEWKFRMFEEKEQKLLSLKIFFKIQQSIRIKKTWKSSRHFP